MQPMPPIPGKPPMPQPAQGGAPSGPAPANPGAGGPPSPGGPGGIPKLPGPQPVKQVGYNQQVQNLLFTRINALSPQEIQILDQIVTPQTMPVLGKIFPELIPLFNQSTAGKPTVRGAAGPQPPPGGGASPGGPPGGTPPGQPSASANPLTNPQSGNPNVSKGLTGGY